MKILTVCQYYYPEPFRITDICEELVKRGHEVTVITGLPNYPMGQIYEGYRYGERRDETINGVKVHRCFTVGRKSGLLLRFINYCSYTVSSNMYVRKLKADYDVVFVNQLSPVMMSKAGITYKKKHGKKLLLYCLDLWPESLTAGGIKSGSAIYRYFYHVSAKIYHAADEVLVTSKSFSKYFADKFGIEGTEYLPQYAETIFTPNECRKKPNETIDLMFAGNVGAAQSVETIIRAAALTLDMPYLRWHIVGDGSELDYVKKLAKKLNVNNVIFHGRKPLQEMPKYYSTADAMLVTMQKDAVLSMTLPGKVQTYMAAGKPIIGAVDGEARAVVEEAECGNCCEAENAESLANAAKDFIKKNLREKYSGNAFRYYKKNFAKEQFIDCLIDLLHKETSML